MPHICIKRNDIQAEALQVLDLKPNTSQRSLIYDTVPQSKYVNPPQNDTIVLLGTGPITFQFEARGLAAWFATNISDGTGAAASGFFSILVSPLTTLGGPPYVSVAGLAFQPLAGPRIPGTPTFDGTLPIPAMAIDLATAINDPLLPTSALVTAVASVPGPSDVTVTYNAVGTIGNTVDFTAFVPPEIAATPPGGFLAGGADADSLTAVEANTIATNILTNIIAFGDTNTAAVDADLAAINAEIAAVVGTASITAGQLQDVLDILAGREYVVPAGQQIDLDGTTYDVQPPVGAPGGPAFGSIRRTYDTGSLLVSIRQGELAGYLRNDFSFGEATGTNLEAVVVYNDDGTLF